MQDFLKNTILQNVNEHEEYLTLKIYIYFCCIKTIVCPYYTTFEIKTNSFVVYTKKIVCPHCTFNAEISLRNLPQLLVIVQL